MENEEEAKEQAIQTIVDLLKREPFTFEVKVVKKPKGIKVIYEVTQEHLDAILQIAEKNVSRKYSVYGRDRDL